MTADDLREELENELLWRQNELVFFKNQLNYVSDDDKDRYRKSLVLLLYSHMEGYIKMSLLTYIKYINALSLRRKDVISNLIVAGMDKEFIAYEDFERKSDFFRRAFPEDKKLHRFYRRVDFVEQIEGFKDLMLNVDDQVIDTESNLWYGVLQKNLYKIGLPIDRLEEYRAAIDGLVYRRNSIAHGNFRSGVSKPEFESWEIKTLGVMTTVTRLIYDYANNRRFLNNFED